LKRRVLERKNAVNWGNIQKLCIKIAQKG